MRTIRFPALIGRSYGFRTLPISLRPAKVDTVPHPTIHTSQPDEISRPASRVMIDTPIGTQPGRAYISHTEDALNLGPVPDRIDRETPASNAGVIGNGMGGWPYDGNAINIPHQIIPRKPITGTVFARNIDTSVTIPTTPIGTPV